MICWVTDCYKHRTIEPWSGRLQTCCLPIFPLKALIGSWVEWGLLLDTKGDMGKSKTLKVYLFVLMKLTTSPSLWTVSWLSCFGSASSGVEMVTTSTSGLLFGCTYGLKVQVGIVTRGLFRCEFAYSHKKISQKSQISNQNVSFYLRI